MKMKELFPLKVYPISLKIIIVMKIEMEKIYTYKYDQLLVYYVFSLY